MIKKFLLSIAVVSALTGMSIEFAEAKRIGGGRSTGIQRQVPMQRQATPPAATPQQQAAPAAAARQGAPGAAAAQQASGWRKWAAPLAGLAAGLGIAALLSHLGVGAEFAGILLAILAVVVVIALLRRFMGGARPAQSQPAYAGAGHDNVRPMAREQAAPQAYGTTASAAAAEDGHFPAGFDIASFERQAKLNFIRLQAANDAGDLADIRDFTSPEVFAEIKLGIDERGGHKQKTDVIVLNAEVLEVVEERGQYIASVRYSGSLREEAGSAPEAFDEVWHLAKPVDGNRGWVLAGIQQVS
ncbi:MAG: TIM44-like domain-containing protein [Candidatus Dactylopiibacterium sp.]|nr:TIM44-like domain-containing protein [Candidatus Dactylopiibacterium sp.]